MCDTWLNRSHLVKWVKLVKCVTLGKMGHIWENGSQLQQWDTLEYIGHIWKNKTHLEKWVRSAKMGHSWKNESHLVKCVTLG